MRTSKVVIVTLDTVAFTDVDGLTVITPRASLRRDCPVTSYLDMGYTRLVCSRPGRIVLAKKVIAAAPAESRVA